ncbi:MAG TPA: potassium channel family protein [Pirellula sp.]|nr:potassium channel family protein [Pirellula sp.]
MLSNLVRKIYTRRSYFYALIAIDFVVVGLFAFLYSAVLPWIEGRPALRFNVIRNGNIFESPITDHFNCLYFSVTTQMTVGFGDIIPATAMAKATVSFQATFGYFYIAILISILVGRVFSKMSGASLLEIPSNN